MFSCEFCKFFRNTFFYRTPKVAASGFSHLILSIFFFSQIFSVDFAPWKKLSLIDCVNIYLLSIFFSIDFLPGRKVWSNPTLLKWWFINFNFNSLTEGHAYLNKPAAAKSCRSNSVRMTSCYHQTLKDLSIMLES